MQSVKYLEQVKDRYQLKTDVALALKLGVGKSAVSHYMKGLRVMDEETCLAVALALEVNPMEVMMAAGIDRAEKTGQKSLWTVFSQRMAATAASTLLAAGVTLFLTPNNAEAAQLLPSFDAGNSTNVYYVKLRNRIITLTAVIQTWLERVFSATSARPANI